MMINALFLLCILFAADSLLNLVVPGARRTLPPIWQFICQFTKSSEKQLNRLNREKGERMIRGVFVTIIVLLIAGTLGVVVQIISDQMQYGWAAELVLLGMTLYLTGPWKVMKRMAKYLQNSKPAEAAKLLEDLTPLDTKNMDEYALARAGIEHAAWALSRGVVGTCFWYLLCGPVGLTLYVGISAMVHMVGYKTTRYDHFSRFLRLLDALAHLVPSRLAAGFIFFAAFFTPRGKPFQALSVMFEQARKYGPFNRGWEVSAMAGALGITLGGAVPLSGGGAQYGWLGPEGSSAKVEPWMLRRAMMLHVAAYVLVLTVLLMILGYQAAI